MKRVSLVSAVTAIFCLFTCSVAFAESWHRIPVESTVEIINDEGEEQTLYPSCAFDTITDPLTGAQLDNSFNFFFKPGDPEKLLVFFNGGGACWNDETCVTSLALASIPDNRPTYNPSMYEENTPIGAGGIFNDAHPKNPFADWTKVFIPYCTGDIHTGSNDYTYEDTLGIITGFPGAPVTVKHRGFDNFMAVREWLKRYYRIAGEQPAKMLVTGSSAGGYGATMNFPYMQAAFPYTATAMFSDAAAGILSSGFVDTAFTLNQPWMVENTLPALFSQFLGAYNAETLNQDMIALLAATYPMARFAQYSTAYDAVQVLFYKISIELDAGNTDPFSWGLTEEDYLLFLDWNSRMTESYSYLDAVLPNYQYYIGAGQEHSVLTDTYVLTEGLHPFYAERSGGVPFSIWLSRFANSWRFIKHSVDGQ